jgi:hypothetical protein
MIDLQHLDPLNYTHIGSFIVPANGKDLIIPNHVELAQTMLIRWQVNQVAKGLDLNSIEPGLLISEIEIPSFGVIESSTFDIIPSNFKSKRIQLVQLNLDLPQKLTFQQSSIGVTNSILEFYAYTGIEAQIYTDRQSNYMPSNNPVIIDPTELANAIATASATANTQNLVDEFNRETSHSTADTAYIATAWSGTATPHIALPLSNTRIGYKLFNRGVNKVYVAVGSPTNKTFDSYIDIIEPGGFYNSSEMDRSLQLILYVAANKPNNPVSISELLP